MIFLYAKNANGDRLANIYCSLEGDKNDFTIKTAEAVVHKEGDIASWSFYSENPNRKWVENINVNIEMWNRDLGVRDDHVKVGMCVGGTILKINKAHQDALKEMDILSKLIEESGPRKTARSL